jgi:hypothetical protein
MTFDALVRTALRFLENPSKLWLSERFEDRGLALRLVFATNLKYDRGAGLEPLNFRCLSRL